MVPHAGMTPSVGPVAVEYAQLHQMITDRPLRPPEGPDPRCAKALFGQSSQPISSTPIGRNRAVRGRTAPRRWTWPPRFRAPVKGYTPGAQPQEAPARPTSRWRGGLTMVA